MNELYQQIQAETERLIEDHTGVLKPTYGRDLLDFPPDDLIMQTLTLPAGEDELEISRTTELARPAYQWLVEVTIRRPETITHFLLQPEHKLVEAYGRKVYDADEETAETLLAYLRQAA